MKIRIGTRGSDLALAQAHYINQRIQELSDPPETELVIIKTTGDQIQNIPLSQVDTGSTPDERKGFFTKEIEDALLEKKVDLAVHSFKDLPTLDVPGLVIHSMPQRLMPFDILVYPKRLRVTETPPFLRPGSRIGTSSVRRISQVEYRWPEMECVPLRGNVPTRIKKLLEGREFDAILLSGAGFERLKGQGFFSTPEWEALERDLDVVPLPPREYVPAPAQGALALQCRSDDTETKALLARLHHREGGELVRVEREVLRSLEGGCHLPLGAYCEEEPSGVLGLHLFLGREAVDNRRKRSFYAYRRGTDAGELSGRVIAEIKGRLPIVLTGRKERIREIMEANPELPLIDLSLIETVELSPSKETVAKLRGWIDAANQDRTGNHLAAAFSAPAALRLHKVIEENGMKLPALRWAVVGEKTAETILEHFPHTTIAYTSPDGTAEALARVILENENGSGSQGEILVSSAKGGRDLFFEIMKENGRSIFGLPLYETRKKEPSAESLRDLPAECYILFGSPSAVDTYFQATARIPGAMEASTAAGAPAAAKESANPGHRYCAIGRTTEEALSRRGVVVYATSQEPDFDLFIEELS